MKLHLCCGDVYLKDFINCDIEIPGYSYFAEAYPEERRLNETTLDKYYKHPLGQNPQKLCIADLLFDLRETSLLDIFNKNTFDIVVMIAAFEHFLPAERDKLLRSIYQILKPGGKFHLNFPDIEESFRAMQHDRNVNNINWQIRLIYGSGKNEFATHHWGYTRETFEHLIQTTTDYCIKYEKLVNSCIPMIDVSLIK